MSSSRLATAMYHFNEIAANGQTAKYVKGKANEAYYTSLFANKLCMMICKCCAK